MIEEKLLDDNTEWYLHELFWLIIKIFALPSRYSRLHA